MKVCDVVTNSIWYDPRVKRQIATYLQNNISLSCVGVLDKRYSKIEVDKIGCPVKLVNLSPKKTKNKKNFFTKVFRTLTTINSLKKEIIKCCPDVIHANDLDSLVPAYYAAKKTHSILIYDTHEIFLENNNLIKKKALKLFWAFFEKKIIKKVDCVVCVSNAAANYLMDKYRIAKPMVITNCAMQSVDRTLFHKKTSYFDVLNHGQFYFGRGYELMIDAAELLRDEKQIRFLLRGYGTIEEQLHNEKEKKQLNNVLFEAPVNVEDLIPYAASSSVGVAITIPYCLNFKLSISNKLFEYAAAGLPVIMSNIPEHVYLNKKYHFGIILEENTAKCLSEAVLELANNHSFYSECSKNAIAMSKELTWEKQFLPLIQFEKDRTTLRSKRGKQN